ncbi:MAG TPA: AAA family ATPase, partial [Armatimonadota bacterium]|nr:AAA family ATPase [Armatimonadota bacterium]
MRLLSLHISGFGSLHERAFTFEPGMNLVIGRNEAGKSTLLHCLAQTLMGKPSRYGAFPDVQPWGRNSFMATLDVEHAGERYRITRRFAERGAKAVTLARVDADDAVNVITQDPRDLARWMGEVFGVSDDTIFYKVFCLSQADMSPLKDNADLYEQLERAISGAEVATAAAVSAIDERLRLLRRGVGERGAKANWGPLQTAIAGRQEAEAKLAEARQADAQFAAAREALATVDARLAEVQERIATLEALMAATREHRELRKRYADLQAIFDGIEQQRATVEATIARRDQLREELEKLALAEADPVSLRSTLARASAVRTEIDRLGAERGALQARLHALPAPYLDTLALRASLHAVERGMLGPRWLIGAVVGLAALALGAWAFSQPIAAVGFFLLAIFLAYLSVSRGQRDAAALYASLGVRDALDADAKIREAEDLFRKIGSLELAIASAETSAAELPNAEELRGRLDTYDTLRQELMHAEGALAALPTPDELAERRRPLGSEMTRIEDALKSVPGGDMTAEDEVRLTRELAEARLRVEALAGEKREAE